MARDGQIGRVALCATHPASCRDRARTQQARQVHLSAELSWTGEDLQPNLSLNKKLQEEFAIALPELPENLVPSNYFHSVRRIVKEQLDWRVREFATLALFEFGKLLLYLDLSSSNWSDGEDPASSPLVQTLLHGGTGQSSSSRELPSPETIDLELDLIDTADSSQATAIHRALLDESLVIQGPPGTGKSQTITNIIGAALAKGETVLFVSEKLAALEVVRRRLDGLGLGQFVLELHSHKTRKQAVVEDLGQRIATGAGQRYPKSIANERKHLKELRDRLDAYAQASGTVVGQIGMPASQILLEAGRARLRLDELASRVPEAAEFEAEAISALDRRNAHAQLRDFELTAEKASAGAPLAQHPWAGVSSDRVVGVADIDAVLAVAVAWSKAIQGLLDAVHSALRDVAPSTVVDGELLSCICQFHAKAEELRALRVAINRAAPLVQNVGQMLGVQLKPDTAGFVDADALVTLAGKAPSHAYDAGQLLSSAADDRLAEAERQLSVVAGLREQLSDVLELGLVRGFEPGRLRLLARTLSQGGLFRWFSSTWRAARARAKPLVIKHGVDWPRIAQCLDDAAELIALETRLIGDPEFVGICGAELTAAPQRLEAAKAVRAWIVEVHSVYGNALTDTRGLGRALLSTPRETLDAFSDLQGGDGAAPEALRHAASALRTRDGLSNASDREPWGWFVERSFDHPIGVALGALDDQQFEMLVDALTGVAVSVGNYRTAAAEFTDITGVDLNEWAAENADLDRQTHRLRAAVTAPDRLPEWLEVDARMRQAHHPLVAVLMEARFRGELPPHMTTVAYDFVLFERLARRALEQMPVLKEFREGDQNTLRRRYREADRTLMQLRSQEIAARLVKREVPQGQTGTRARDLTQLRLIEREVAKQRKHIPIRQLVARAGEALQALKPCFMMGPLSVAQYLPASSLRFDLVVFDEASQLRPEETIGALARASRAIIVGDSKQLPPTRFFERTGDGEEDADDRAVIASSDSILEVAETRLPAEMLRWHYRSQHPKLIEFSNRRFYDGRLLLFPSPNFDTKRMGVRFHHIADGVFEDQQNRPEAESIVDAALEHMRLHPDESLGIVTMNVKQRELIEQLLDRKLQQHAQIGERFDRVRRVRDEAEPLFVKNLENVQGDERDVILISMTYGPPQPGARVPHRFGPINGPDGWRRLNVLFTRSKIRMEVFSSMTHGDIVPSDRGGSRGQTEMKAFLQFAEVGVLAGAPSAGTGRDPDSDFEVAVLEGLRQHGFTCVPQVGSGGFFIDIGVEDPARPGTFLAGVECDGTTYHSTLSARDRDRLRQEILEQMGWHIERVWSTDWFRDPSRELQRLVTNLRALLAPKSIEATPASRSLQFDSDVVEGDVENVVGEDEAKDEVSEATHADSPEDVRLLTMDAARAELEDIRLHIAYEHPEYDPGRSLLRPEMIDALLEHRPIDLEEFRERIPRKMRLDTSADEMPEYGDFVFEVLERMG